MGTVTLYTLSNNLKKLNKTLFSRPPAEISLNQGQIDLHGAKGQGQSEMLSHIQGGKMTSSWLSQKLAFGDKEQSRGRNLERNFGKRSGHEMT